MKTKLSHLIALIGLALSALPATAQIAIVNDDNTTFANVVPDAATAEYPAPGQYNLEANPWTVSFDAGATANKLIVALSSETGGSGPPVITYNGAPLTQVPGTANNRVKGIWYLDNPFTGGAADLVIDMTSYTNVNGIGFGVVSVSGAAPGTTGGAAAVGLEVSITTTVADSLIVSAYASNSGISPTVPSGHSQLYASAAIGSASGAAAYQNVLAPAGLQTITYAQAPVDGNSTSAAGFAPAPALSIVSTTPADNATDAPLGGDLVATFNETVEAGTGNIELWQVGSGSPLETFDVTSEVVFSGQTLTINPTSDLVVGVEYYVLIPSTAVVGTISGDTFAGIADPTTWSFGDTAPLLVALSPADDAANVALDANLVATFSETVQAGTGTIELWKTGDGSPVETFDVTSSTQLTFTGATLTIDPTADLDPSSGYYVIIPATAVVDLSSQAFAGLAGTEAWNFGTLGQTWDGGDIDGFWTSVLNWDADAAPDFAQPITFQGSTRSTNQNDLAAASTVGGINFINDGTAFTNAFTLQGPNATTTNSMTLGGDITTTARPSGTNENQIHASLDVILDGNRTITTSDFHNLRINGQISETGESRSLTKEGVGNLTLGNSSLTTDQNSFSGGININNGSVNLVGSATRTAAAGTGTIFLGATSGSNAAELRSAGTFNAPNAITVNAGSAGVKTLANRSANSTTFSGNITANDNLTILAANNGGRLTTSGTGNSVADGKTVSFSNTGTVTNAMIDSALWGGDGAISYTSSTQMGFTVSGAKTYTGGASLGAMSGDGVIVVQTSSNGPANAPTDGAFGTGTLSIGPTKMRGGNVNPLTIGNPILFIDNPTFVTTGGEVSLIFTGNASLGATRTLTVEVGSTVATEEVEFSGVISGTGFGITKEGAGNLLLSGTNTYTGNTTVNAGVLALTGASIADTGTLVINAGTVDLTNTETVSALFFGATPQPDGDYSASSVPVGATITTASFSGAGTLTVGAPTGSAYTLWAATNAPTGTPADDFDGDGVSNAVEFVLGGLATTNDLDKLPTLEADGINMTFTFNRAVSSIDPKTVVTIEVSTDLVTWDTLPSPYTVPDSATGPVNPGVTVEEDTSPGFDTVTLSVPQDTAKKFARLNVIIIP